MWDIYKKLLATETKAHTEPRVWVFQKHCGQATKETISRLLPSG